MLILSHKTDRNTFEYMRSVFLSTKEYIKRIVLHQEIGGKNSSSKSTVFSCLSLDYLNIKVYYITNEIKQKKYQIT